MDHLLSKEKGEKIEIFSKTLSEKYFPHSRYNEPTPTISLKLTPICYV